MKGIELLNKYPESAKIIRAWFLEKMIESLQTADVPDELKSIVGQDRDNTVELQLWTYAQDQLRSIKLWDYYR